MRRASPHGRRDGRWYLANAQGRTIAALTSFGAVQAACRLLNDLLPPEEILVAMTAAPKAVSP